MRVERLFGVLVLSGAALTTGAGCQNISPGGDVGGGDGADTPVALDSSPGDAGADASSGETALPDASGADVPIARDAVTVDGLICGGSPADPCGCPCCWVNDCSNTDPCCGAFRCTR